MSKVFFGGSRKLGRLNPAIRARLNKLIANGHTVLVGDANGADKAVQQFFLDREYRHVVVYSMEGRARNNLGGWPTESIVSKRQTQDHKFFAEKDERMSREADYGFMLWDGSSSGTLNNVLNLLQQGKPALVWVSPQKRFAQLNAPSDLRRVVEEVLAGRPDLLKKLNAKIKLDVRMSDKRVSFGI